jgi:hypothetical protein
LSGNWSSVPGSSEFWAAIIGSVVGGVLTALTTWKAERIRLSVTAGLEWRRVTDSDLREFQNAAVLAVHTLVHDLERAWDHYIGTGLSDSKRWGPVDSPAAYAIVVMLSTRLESTSVKNEFAIMARSIWEAQGILSRLPSPNPFISMLTIDTKSDEPLTPDKLLADATLKAEAARQQLTKVQESCAQAYADLRKAR